MSPKEARQIVEQFNAVFEDVKLLMALAELTGDQTFRERAKVRADSISAREVEQARGILYDEEPFRVQITEHYCKYIGAHLVDRQLKARPVGDFELSWDD